MKSKTWTMSAALLCVLAVTACGIELPEIAPSTPRGLTLATNDGLVTMSWTANSEPDLKGYNLYYGQDASMGQPVFVPQPATAHVVNGLSTRATYQFAISAVNTAGAESDLSAPVSVTLTRPMLVRTVPANDSTAQVDTRIELQFTEPMDMASLSVSTEPDIHLGSPTWNSERTQVTFQPAIPLSYETRYSLTVSGRDMAGNGLNGQLALSFQTAPMIDTTPPSVVSSAPGDKTTGVGINTSISFTFSEAMDTASVRSAFSIVPNAGGAVMWDETQKIMTFSPTSPLNYSTEYTVTLSTDATDAAGNKLASSYNFNFTTGNAPDTTAPTISNYSPNNAQKGVNRTSSISVSFSEPMNKAYTQAAFAIIAPAGMSGQFSWSPDGKTMTFTPATSFAYGTNVSWRVTTGAEDLAGNSLAVSADSNFTVIRQEVLNLPVSTDGQIAHDIVQNIDTADTSLDYYRVGLGYNIVQTGGLKFTFYPYTSMAFMTFNIDSLPASLTTITSAYLNIYISTLRTEAYSKYGDMNVSSVNYGIGLETYDYTGTIVYSTTTARPTTDQWASIPVSSMVDADWKNRSARGHRSQFRLHFNVTENSSVTNGSLTWTSHLIDSSRGTNKPYLQVVYEVP